MSTPTLLLLLVTATVVFVAAEDTSNTTTSAKSTSTSFIKDKCSTTSFPELCVESLSAYSTKIQQSPRQLAQTALTVSLSRARAAKESVAVVCSSKGLKPKEVAALKDCKEEMGDMVDRLGKSTKELQRAGRARYEERKWRISNVETWVSAGLTDENTCLDGFAGRALDGKVKDAVRAQVLDAVHCTSNALALINQYANSF